jgi:hypothetical protein
MPTRQLMAPLLVPADQHPSAPGHPTRGPLHHPPTGLVPCCTRPCLGVLTPGPAGGGAPPAGPQLAHVSNVRARVQAPALGRRGGRCRPRHRATLERRPGPRDGMPLGARDGHPQGDAAAVGEPAPLGPDLPAIGRMLAHRVPPPAGLGASPRPWPAPPRQGPARQHRPSGPAPSRPGRRRPPSTPGSGDGRHGWHSGPSLAGRALGLRGGGRRRWHPGPGARPRVTGGTRAAAASGAGAAVGGAPTVRRGDAHHAERSPGRHAWRRLLWERSVSPQDTPQEPIGIGSKLDFCPFPQPRMVMKIANHWLSWCNSSNRLYQ